MKDEVIRFIKVLANGKLLSFRTCHTCHKSTWQMPICTTCTAPVNYLYTVYESKNNLRLEECPKCSSFVDPYVEYDTLNLLLDLILLKRGVYRHLLFNRGWPPRKDFEPAEKPLSQKSGFLAERERLRRITVAKLGMALICIDTFIRWSNHFPLSTLEADYRWDGEAGQIFLKIFTSCLIETITFHIGVMLASIIVSRIIRILKPHEPALISRQVRLSHIPLTLLYSSFTKIFLLLCLSIWRPEIAPITTPNHAEHANIPILNNLLNMLDEDKMDRHWLVRNVIGGISAGFGLRVALDCHPSLTALIITIGWSFKAWISHLASQWLGIAENAEWMAYSIP